MFVDKCQYYKVSLSPSTWHPWDCAGGWLSPEEWCGLALQNALLMRKKNWTNGISETQEVLSRLQGKCPGDTGALSSFREVEEEVVRMLLKGTCIQGQGHTKGCKTEPKDHMRKACYPFMRYQICWLLPFPWPCARQTLSEAERVCSPGILLQEHEGELSQPKQFPTQFRLRSWVLLNENS